MKTATDDLHNNFNENQKMLRNWHISNKMLHYIYTLTSMVFSQCSLIYVHGQELSYFKHY